MLLRRRKPEPEEMAEGELIAAAKDGDDGAFAELVRRNQSIVYGTLLRLAKNRPDADDLFQETFLAAWRHLGTFAGDAKFSTWLCRLAINKYKDKMRADKARLTALPTDDGEDDPLLRIPDDSVSGSPEGEILRAETVAEVRLAVDELPDDLREALVLRETYDLSYDEIAVRLSVPVGTVKSRIARARNSLKNILEKRNFFPPDPSNRQNETKGGTEND
ncbi:MAG: sigma-70 family RNA polymerase sigma factor [Clostridia bacterium]|nr:sigma-70 family RNA polymerase sigma factor [Clostridia bacterium]